MNDQHKQLTAEKPVDMPRPSLPAEPNRREQGDDRYPGSFFRIPGLAVPGKTGWSLS
ncbi:hypothetical protein [Methylobacter sp. YRD-M1]|uniref:hypothetical protein n=1 Tax=Methylobacter sp. YRD-M1 TaxID=2911520 RepID=UPI00227ACE6F|nr:hypothetical protein [Methylobacter sp. YRD-M1]WAK01262.1 hypothetical protein LZ558_15705 [Methylobacter sp. YRD-M1]